MNRSHGRETLTTFLDEANNFHPSINFTAEISTKQHMFLETKSNLVGDTISVYKTNRYTPVSPTYKLPPETLLQKCSLQLCTSPQSNVLPFVLSYRPDLPKVRDIVNKHWPIIESSSNLSEFFTERLTMAYRRPKCLWDLLVRAKLKPDMRDDETLGETKPCDKAKCKTCKMITPTQIAKSASGATIKLRCNISCKTINVVYLISCTKC